jgi:hypothetical protein
MSDLANNVDKFGYLKSVESVDFMGIEDIKALQITRLSRREATYICHQLWRLADKSNDFRDDEGNLHPSEHKHYDDAVYLLVKIYPLAHF